MEMIGKEYVKYGGTPGNIEEPVIPGNTLLGWSTVHRGTVFFDFTKPLTADVTLYAYWETYIPVYSGYYQGIDDLTGEALIDALREIVTDGLQLVTYGDARYRLGDTDADPKKKGNLILVYTRVSVAAAWDGGITWNREHVWPQSRLGATADNGRKNIASDLHNLRPADPATNSSRGNKNFSFTTASSSFFPGDSDKGDIARILFYMTICYPQLRLISGLSNDGALSIGNLDALLIWNQQDPVDEFEMRRNEKIYSIQKNRNPFIDHPELVEKIWGAAELSSFGNEIKTVYLGLYIVDVTELEKYRRILL